MSSHFSILALRTHEQYENSMNSMKSILYFNYIKKDCPAKGEIELNCIENKKWRVFKCWTDVDDMMKPSVIGPYLN